MLPSCGGGSDTHFGHPESELQPLAAMSATRLAAQKKRKRAAVRPARCWKDRDVASKNQPGRGASLKAQTLKDDPQPQVDFTFGLLNLNPAPWRPST